MNSRTIKFPEKLYEQLQEAADKKNITMASIVRIACSEYIEREEKQKEENKQ